MIKMCVSNYRCRQWSKCVCQIIDVVNDQKTVTGAYNDYWLLNLSPSQTPSNTIEIPGAVAHH